MKHKVLIDTISLLSPLTGIGRYTYEISKRLNSEYLEYYYYYGKVSKKLIGINENNNLKKLKSIFSANPILKKTIRYLLKYKESLSKKKFDLYWEPNFIPLTTIKTDKLITTIHDFSFEIYKEYHPKEKIDYFQKNFYKNIKKSNFIITGSEFTKNEILKKLNFEEKDIKVIYHGVNHNIFKECKDLDLSFNLPKKFILSVGSIEPRKNLISLLKAYISLPTSLKKEYKLVLVGFKGWNNKDIIKVIEKNKKDIIYLGYISDMELAKVYNLANLFVYPSLYEGFGLPPLEAMACGTPVITSNVSSLPEVGGNAVIYCNPYDIYDIKEKIEIVLNDDNLQKIMIKKGLKRAKEFSWKKSAKEHLKVFKEVLNS